MSLQTLSPEEFEQKLREGIAKAQEQGVDNSMLTAFVAAKKREFDAVQAENKALGEERSTVSEGQKVINPQTGEVVYDSSQVDSDMDSDWNTGGIDTTTTPTTTPSIDPTGSVQPASTNRGLELAKLGPQELIDRLPSGEPTQQPTSVADFISQRDSGNVAPNVSSSALQGLQISPERLEELRLRISGQPQNTGLSLR